MSQYSIIIPAYQEAENLKKLLPEINVALAEFADDWEILVVDTEQPLDDTQNVCAAIAHVRHLRRRGGNVYRSAIVTGIAEAQFDRVFVMDADGSHSPSVLAPMAKLGNDYDLVIGSRYIEGGKTENPRILILMSQAVNIVYRLVFHISVRDVSDSLRLYRRDQLCQLELQSDNFDIVEEILIKLLLRYPQLRLIEMPVCFQKRDHGKTKRNLVKFAFSFAFSVLRLLKLKYEYARKLHE